MMLSGVRKFELLRENDYWMTLRKANQQHVTSQQLYGQLLDKLEANRVNFKDIRAFMLNEAKRCGLLQKNYFVEGKGFQYPPKKKMKQDRLAWFVALQNFCNWVAYNYDGDYGRVRKHLSKEERKEQKKELTVTRRSSDGKESTETRTVITGASKEELLSSVPEGATVTSPITSDLSKAQLQALFISYPDVLGEIAEQQGAVKQFNALCIAMGGHWLDAIIPVDDPEIEADAEQVALDSITDAPEEVAVQ